MTCPPILVADAVTAAINAASVAIGLPTGCVARRSYADWDESFEGLKDATVDVVFLSANGQAGSEIRLQSEGSLEYMPGVDVVVRKRFEPEDRDSDGRLLNASVDPLVNLLQKIHEHFVALRASTVLDGVPEANWTDSSIMSWVNQRKLRRGAFEGVVRIKFTYQKVI